MVTLYFLIPKKWTSFTAYGGISGQIFQYKKYLIFGTDYTKLYIVNKYNSKGVKTIDLNMGTVMPQKIEDGYVYAIAGDTYWKIDIKKAKVVWSFSSPNNNYINSSELRDGLIFLSDLGGTLYALNGKTGKLIWKFESQKLDKISDRYVNGNLYYSPDYWLKEKAIYLADRSGMFYKLNKNNGKVVWKSNLNDVIVGNFTVYKNQAFVFGKSGKIYSINLKNGNMNWQKDNTSPAICSGMYKSDLMEVLQDGRITRRKVNNGDLVWRSVSLGMDVNCPGYYSDDGIFTSSANGVIRIDMKTGMIISQENKFGSISSAPTTVKQTFGKKYVITDSGGSIFSLDKSFNTVWGFKTDFPVTSSLSTSGNDIYFGNSNGEVYRINKYLGGIKNYLPFLEFSTKVESKKIANNEIFEITLRSKSEFENPWMEGVLKGVFTGESGIEIKIDGFYYDGTDWKIRFNPPEMGKWKYKLEWSDHGVRFTKNGELVTKTDTKNSFLKISKTNSKRLTLDGKTVFNGLGWQETWWDNNGNGNTLDDWSIGNGNFEATSSSGIEFYSKSNVHITIDEYIKTYGPNGSGFNLYRYSIMNANNSLYRDITRPPVFSVRDGKMADIFLESLRKNNIHVQLAFFHFYVPYMESFTPVEQSLLRQYIRYVVARFGAYTDIWEIVNELDLKPKISDFVVNELKNLDFENRPITTSTPDGSEDAEYSGINIISPHWYETEDVYEADTKINEIINRYKDYQKPVVLGEQGNGPFNWDETSATRMRVRLWSSFFNQGIVTFWSMSDTKGVPRAKPYWANIYLGEEERKYVRYLQDFIKDFPLESKPFNIVTNNSGIRGYGLQSENNLAGYFFHFADYKSPTSFSVNLSLQKPGVIEWYNPVNGKVLRKDMCSNKNCFVSSPIFTTDLAFRFVE